MAERLPGSHHARQPWPCRSPPSRGTRRRPSGGSCAALRRRGARREDGSRRPPSRPTASDEMPRQNTRVDSWRDKTRANRRTHERLSGLVARLSVRYEVHPSVAGLPLKDEHRPPREELPKQSAEWGVSVCGARRLQCGHPRLVFTTNWGLRSPEARAGRDRRTSERLSSPRRNSMAHVPASDRESRQPAAVSRIAQRGCSIQKHSRNRRDRGKAGERGRSSAREGLACQ